MPPKEYPNGADDRQFAWLRSGAVAISYRPSATHANPTYSPVQSAASGEPGLTGVGRVWRLLAEPRVRLCGRGWKLSEIPVCGSAAPAMAGVEGGKGWG